MKTKYNGYRMLTLLIPLNPHDTELNRRSNIKLSNLLRWYVYTYTGGLYYRLAPQEHPMLQHGALCISGKRGCKFDAETVRKALCLDRLIPYLKQENLCQYIQILDDGGVGNAIPLPLIYLGRSTKKQKPICIEAKRLHKGPSMDPAHIPYFARQMLIKMRDMPVEQCDVSLEAYHRRFHFPYPPKQK